MAASPPTGASPAEGIPADWGGITEPVALHSALLAQVETLEQAFEHRRQKWRACLERYLDRAVGQEALDDLLATISDWKQCKPTNVIAQVVDTVHSHTAEIQPRPWFMSVSGSYQLQRKAKNLTRACKSDFDEYDYEEHISDAQLDALIGDAGVLRMSAQDGAPALERVLPYRLIVDPAEYDRKVPSTYWYVRPMDARQLKAAFPDAPEDALCGAKILSEGGDSSGPSQAMIDVVEVVRLPCGDKPGRRVSFTSAGVLEQEEYEYPFPPYIVLRFRRNPGSFWGIGLAETLAGSQSDIDFKDGKIRQNENWMNGKWVVDKGSGITPQQLDDTNAVLEKEPQTATPEWLHPPPVGNDVRQSRRESIDGSFAAAGVSQMAASAEKPPGLDSGEAQRVHVQITSKRFRKWQEVVQKVFLTVGKMWAQFILRDDAISRSRKVIIQIGRGLKELTYGDLALDVSKYRVSLKASSFFATSPAALMQELQEYLRIGMFTAEQALRIQQTGDLEAEYDLIAAPGDLADARLEAMVDTGEYMPPEPWFDLQLHIDRGTLYYQRCELEGVEQDKLALLRRYITACIDEQAMQNGDYPAPDEGGGGAGAGAGVEGPEGPPIGPEGPGGPGAMQAAAQAATAEAQRNSVRNDAMAQVA